jgi:hypothetical protein
MNNYNQKLFETMNNNAPNLISKNIDDYFNKLLNDINNESVINNKPTFYTTYIEHNILLIVILVCIAIFLFFRYYSKARSNDEEDEGGEGGEGNRGNRGNRGGGEDDGEKKKSDSKKKRKKIIKKHIDNELRSLYEERQLLENEKKSLLNIIDDLSNYNVKSDILTDTSISARVEGAMDRGSGGGGGDGSGGGRGERDGIIEQYEEYNNDNYNQFLDINSSNITKVNNINIENPYI